MGLDLGELTIRLDLENDRLRAGMGQAKRELQTLPPVARQEMVKVSRVMDEEGRRSGGLLAQGVRTGFIRNSPLIVAGIGAALAAGAPLVTAAAGTLFAGVGAVSAAQTLEVRQAWTELGQEIRGGAVADAAVLVPVYTEMADKIGAAFQRMRPQLREAFADSAPLIDSFTDGVIALAENAMPGLGRSIASAGPVFDGFERFLAATGTGLTDFFDAISSRSPAAGSAFASLGDIMGALLPILGEILGQGAELAADVLPAVAGTAGVVLDVMQALGPALPLVAQGFIAIKVAGVAATAMAAFGGAAAKTTTAMTGSAAAGGRVSGLFDKMGRTLPVIGLAFVGLSEAIGAAGEAQDEMTTGFSAWFAAARQGGQAAEEAQAKIATLNQRLAEYEPEWGGADVSEAFLKARDAAQDYERALTPTEAAQERLAAATRTLDEVLADEGATTGEVAAAQREYEAATAESEAAQGRLELAVNGVNSAMLEQAEQAIAAIDSGFAYRKSVDDLEDAQTALNDAIKEHGAGSEEAQRAQLGLEEQTFRTAEAFARQQADLSGLSEDSMEYKRIVQEQMLGELYRLQSAAGPEMAAAIGLQIAELERSGVTMSSTSVQAVALSGRMRDLGLSVTQIPGQKFVQISAPTEDQRRRIAELGYAVYTLPNGQVVVYADTGPARREVAAFMAANAARSIVVSIFGRSGAAAGGPIQGFAGGGPVRGPGGPTDDAVPAFAGRTPFRLSNGEHVLTAKDVQAMGGQGQVMAFRQALHDARGFAAGGPVTTGAAENASGRDRALFHADTVNVVEGTPEDVAQILAYKARTEGW